MASQTQSQSRAAVPTNSLEFARSLDAHDPLRTFRSEFIVPTKGDLRRKTLAQNDALESAEDSVPCIYLCGNSLGLQPKQTARYIQDFLTSWATKAVTGHFTGHEDAPHIPTYLHADDYAAGLIAPIVGASKEEVACMGTLTGNLHLLLSSFYRPDPPGTESGRHKIILEGKAFPSDHFAIQSQIQSHGYDPQDSMILLEPPQGSSILTTESVISTLKAHASSTAVVLLPGVQFYTGQFLALGEITAAAHALGIPYVGVDLAHAVANVPLQLHDWNIDFAVWCSYKYLNAGPGTIGGLFVHERHGIVETAELSTPGRPSKFKYHPRLAGWWGSSKTTRFAMVNEFEPLPGAKGYQVSNPSILDLTALNSSLEIFSRVPGGMATLREKSVQLTSYLEILLCSSFPIASAAPGPGPAAVSQNPPPTDLRTTFEIITPSDPSQRGAQLSIRLRDPTILPRLLPLLEGGVNPKKEGRVVTAISSSTSGAIIVDERKPDVIRVAPAPLYNGWEDCWRFCEGFFEGLARVVGGAGSEGADGQEAKMDRLNLAG